MTIYPITSKPTFRKNASTREYAASLDAADPLATFRDKFIIPSKANINHRKLAKPGRSWSCIAMAQEKKR